MIKGVVRYTPPETWGVLCIDVWDNNGTNDIFYQGIVDNLSQYNVGAVINCTLDHRIDYSDQSIFNTFKKYVWDPAESNPDHILQLIREDIIRSSGQRPVSKILNEKLFNDHTYSLNSCKTFNHHVQSYYPQISDWIIVGGAWKICIHAGPLGIGRVLESLVAQKFYVFPEWSIQNEDQTLVSIQQIEDDEYVWAPVENNGYRLVTKIGGKWQR